MDRVIKVNRYFVAPLIGRWSMLRQHILLLVKCLRKEIYVRVETKVIQLRSKSSGPVPRIISLVMLHETQVTRYTNTRPK